MAEEKVADPYGLEEVFSGFKRECAVLSRDETMLLDFLQSLMGTLSRMMRFYCAFSEEGIFFPCFASRVFPEASISFMPKRGISIKVDGAQLALVNPENVSRYRPEHLAEVVKQSYVNSKKIAS